MNRDVDAFVKKSKQWKDEIAELRRVLLKAKLEEELKWGKPCYCYKGNNIAIIQPFKSSLGLMFFKGMLLKDKEKLLVDNGPNSQAAKRFEFSSVQDIKKKSATIKAYVKEATQLEENGKKVEFKKKPEAVPEELKKMFTKKPKLKEAFQSLTPGRQRAYILHFAGAKQSITRTARIEKCIPQILAGRGMHDR